MAAVLLECILMRGRHALMMLIQERAHVDRACPLRGGRRLVRQTWDPV